MCALEDAKVSGEFDGPRGIQGEKGDTPERGVDYWTEADKQEVVSEVLAALPTAEGTSIFASGIEDLQTSLMSLFNAMPERSSKSFEVLPFNTDQFSIPPYYMALNAPVVCEFHKFDSNNGVLSLQACGDRGVYMQRAAVRDGALTEFEWVNPPLTPWVLYRTTDRFMGKPVAKVIIETTLPETSSSVTVSMYDFMQTCGAVLSGLVGAVATNSFCVAPHAAGYTNQNFELSANYDYVTINYDKNFYGGWKCQVLLSYTVGGQL